MNRRALATKCRALAFTGIGLFAANAAGACTVNATSFQFGTINPLIATSHDSTSIVTVTCPSLTSYTVALGPGSGTFSQRQMSDGTNTLDYNLYTDSAHTEIWGDGSGSTATVSGQADDTGTDHTVYGRLPHQPTAVVGSYSDSITVTVTY
jgi:spore coat protein U-like protein